MHDPPVCDLCSRNIPPHGHYIVRIDVFADPSIPGVTQEQMDSADFEQTLNQLLKEMESLSADDLQDQVHRRFHYRLCRDCQVRFLANPLGRPRRRADGAN